MHLCLQTVEQQFTPALVIASAVVANFKKKLTMRHIFTIFILSISLLTFGQNLTNISVRINNEPLDSLPRYVIKLNETEYHLDTIPDSINPKWIEKIEVLKSEREKYIYGNRNGIILIYPKKRYFKKIGLLLESTPNSQLELDSAKVEKIVTDFFNWYIGVIKTNNSVEFMPQIIPNDQGMTTLDFSKYLENLRKYQFSDSLIESERLTYQECISHLEKVKFSDFKTSWTDLDDFESTNCDFANSYRWTGGMEPIDCIKIFDLKLISNQTGKVQLKFCGIDSNDMEYFWGKKIVVLEKQNYSWKIVKID